MAGWVGVLEGVVDAVAIPVEGLRRQWVGRDRVGLDEAAELRIVVAGVVVVQARVLVQNLAGIAMGEAEGVGQLIDVIVRIETRGSVSLLHVQVQM